MSGGDEQRFRDLYDRTVDRIWAFVLRRSPEDAVADVVSETYLAVWRRIRDVPRDERSADAWVFGTARRVLANSRRGSDRRQRLFGVLRQRPVDLVIDPGASDPADQRVLSALARLRPEDRDILILAFWDDLEVEQIAIVLGCSKNAAAIRLTRARRALRGVFDAESGDVRDERDGDGRR